MAGALPRRPQRAAVIGAGVAGIQAARALRSRAGVPEVVLFEKSHDVGGVWLSNYQGYKAQVTRPQYHLPELWPEGLDWYPDGLQLLEHTRRYVEAFGLDDSLKTGCEVLGVSRAEAGGWRVTWRHDRGQGCEGGLSAAEFDLVVLAVGNFSRHHVPEVPGAEDFEGLQVHSGALADATVLVGRKVAVVGCGKSALECLGLAAERAEAVTLVARTMTWVLPQHFCGVPLRFMTGARWFAALAFPPYYNAGVLRRLLGLLLAPVQWLLWTFVLAPLLWLHLRFPKGLRPSVSLRWQLWNGHSVSISDVGALRRTLRRETVSCLRGGVSRLTRGGVVVRGRGGKEQEVAADVVVYATGYREAWSRLFDEPTRAALSPGSAGPELYRQIVPAADLPGLAFVGRVVSTSDVVAAFFQAEWLAAAVAGRVHIPCAVDRSKNVTRYMAWRSQFPPTASSTYMGCPLLHAYLDELAGDMQPSGLREPGGRLLGPCRALLRCVQPLDATRLGAGLLAEDADEDAAVWASKYGALRQPFGPDSVL